MQRVQTREKVGAFQSESGLWGLVLLGKIAEGFLDGLNLMATLPGFLRGLVVHDVSGEQNQALLVDTLAGVTFSYGQLPWFGEVENRQHLVDLLPPAQIGILLDSRTVARPTGTFQRLDENADCFSALFVEAGKSSRRLNVFRGGLGIRVNKADHTQVVDPGDSYSGSFESFTFERR